MKRLGLGVLFFAWWRHFGWAIVALMDIYLAIVIVGAEATTPLIGHVPWNPEPQPQITQCIPISGGHGCPGG